MKIVLPLILMLCVSCGLSVAQTFSSVNDDGVTLYYEVYEGANKTAKLVKAPEDAPYEGSIVVPSDVNYNSNTFRVVAVGAGAFLQSTVTDIVLPNSITMIGQDAFSMCPNLEHVEMGDGVNSIGESAFYQCTSLSKIELPPLLKTIEQFTFSGCPLLDSVVIPESVTKIGQSAFYNCVSLHELVIPDSVTMIDRYAFWCCMSLHTLTIGKGVTMIESMAFANNTKLKTIYWNAKNVPNYQYIDYYGEYRHPFTNAPIRRVVFGDEVESVPVHAFANFTTLESVYFGESMRSIGDNAFDGCEVLANITSAAINPPAISIMTFNKVLIDIPIYVPCESVDSYQSHQLWGRFNNIACDTVGYYIFAVSNVGKWGTAGGGGVFEEGEEITLTATAYNGYVFDCWNDGEVESTRSVVVKGDKVYIAQFKLDDGVGVESPVIAQIKVYPNPTAGPIRISSTAVEYVEVYDIVGRRVMRVRGQSSIDLSNLEAGVYNLRIVTPQGIALRKIIKR